MADQNFSQKRFLPVTPEKWAEHSGGNTSSVEQVNEFILRHKGDADAVSRGVMGNSKARNPFYIVLVEERMPILSNPTVKSLLKRGLNVWTHLHKPEFFKTELVWGKCDTEPVIPTQTV